MLMIPYKYLNLCILIYQFKSLINHKTLQTNMQQKIKDVFDETVAFDPYQKELYK